MREIEIKARLNDRQSVLTALRGMGVHLSAPISQHDVVYGTPGDEQNTWGKVWLRVRTENESRIIFTLKTSVSAHLDNIEHEVIVSDGAELTAMLSFMGFQQYSELTKHRIKGTYGRVELCVDTIDGLGDFIEAEMLTDPVADYNAVVQQLWAVFAQLGIERSDAVFCGYDVLLRQKLGLEPS